MEQNKDENNETPEVKTEETDGVSTGATEKKEDDDFSWGAAIAVLVVIVAAVWALIHFNPSEEKHMNAIQNVVAEVVAESYLDGTSVSLAPSSLRALSSIKYHSLGIVSWTTMRQGGHTKIASIGAVGFVLPFVGL
ncbi:MAG: hypothetical protein HDS69_07770 [Bacteroidales bacterium]|nr:hypothetical protein [Bacteroidales bacterium]MBD5247517.1 hypothetical protein [Barnesiella sp.]